jgi:tRNA threonylcarbamoyladenosine biosynthesis protein TsaE
LDNAAAKISFDLKDEDETLSLGAGLAEIFMRLDKYPAVLFSGPLGAGKTTMIRGIVGTLPGGGDAAMSSPSFNILNIYPTIPETAHFDLYRLEGLGLDPESEEILLNENMLVLVEWSEFLPRDLWPEDSVQVNLFIRDSVRRAELIIQDKLIKDMINTQELNPLRRYAG